MAYEYKMRRTVEFSDTDMAGIMHFANFFRFMEVVEHRFFRSLGLKLHGQTDDQVFGWARAESGCSFKRPLRYEDVVELHLLVREKRRKTLSYVVVFRVRDPEADGDGPFAIEVARGSLTVVRVSRPIGSMAYRATEMPPDVDAKIEEAPPELLA